MKRRTRSATLWSSPCTGDLEEVMQRGSPSQLEVTARIKPGHEPDVTMSLTVWNPEVVGERIYDVRPGTWGGRVWRR